LKVDLLRLRLRNQKLARSDLRTPAEVVAWLGAAQAQDYPAAKWAIGLRANGITDAQVEQAFNDGAILRTHVLRPTWHFVTPADIRWMLALTAPRVHTASAYYYRKNELDSRVFARSHRTLERALRGGKQLTRAELAAALGRAGIAVDNLRLGLLMMRAELDAVICSGAKRGAQFTYALLEERAPRAISLKPDKALAELTRRYFSSHGPATLRDYAGWSGLTVSQARSGIEMIKPDAGVEQAVIDGLAYFFIASGSPAPARTPAPRSSSPAYLLPNFDEYLVAYKDRGPVGGPPRASAVGSASAADPSRGGLFAPSIVIDGRLAGTWKRTLTKDSVLVEAVPYARLTHANARALAAAAERYGRFINKTLSLSSS